MKKLLTVGLLLLLVGCPKPAEVPAEPAENEEVKTADKPAVDAGKTAKPLEVDAGTKADG